jgi:hypothetical protein
MRYSASEKAEIIKLVEQSHLPAKRTLDKLGIPRATFYLYGRLSRCKTILTDLPGQLQTSIRRHPIDRGAQMGNPLAHAFIAGRPRWPR